MSYRTLWTRASFLVLLLSGACAPIAIEETSDVDHQGEPFDDRPSAPPGWDDGDEKADRGLPYRVPTHLPELIDPQIIISLDGLTLHLFDLETSYSWVYPVGVGVLNKSNRSVTPLGHFTTGGNTRDRWWYMPSRNNPEYYDGLPFLRITARNRRGNSSYGIHGPITEELMRGYVSDGCVRLAPNDIVEVFTLLKLHPKTPVTIQKEVELDAVGDPVEVDSPVTLWELDETIVYGDSVGPRD